MRRDFICIFFVAWVYLWMGTSCENDLNKVRSLSLKQIGVEEAKQVLIQYTQGGETKTIITSPLMRNVQDAVPYVEFPQTIHADFYNEQGEKESVLTAQYAKYQRLESKVFLKGDVRVVNLQKGDTLICQELYWDRNKKGTEFYTDKPVRVRTRTETIDGQGLEASQDFRNWHILHSTGTLKLPPNVIPPHP
jgi:LPS export ABC transporter protein LptC